jgi:hypothetical protein
MRLDLPAVCVRSIVEEIRLDASAETLVQIVELRPDVWDADLIARC